MFVMNLKLNTKKILIICLIIAFLVALIVEVISFMNSNNNSYDYVITDENFTNMLKTIHEDIEGNLGKKIKLSGFVFNMPDFKENNFVCGRNMLLYDDAKVVGFLCEYDKKHELLDAEWIEITGTFVKGFYSCDMPVIKVETCTKISAPANSFVDPPTI